MDRLARVLLHVDALDPDLAGDARLHVDQHLALADDRVLVLADLVALRQVRVEIVLAVEDRLEVDLRLQPQPRAHRLFDAVAVDHRQHSGHRRVDQADIGVGLCPESGRGAREQLGFARDLGVDLHADHHFPVVLDPGDGLGLGFAIGEFGHGGSAGGYFPAF